MFRNKKYLFLLISNELNVFEVLGVFSTFESAKSFYNHYSATDRRLKIVKKVLNPTQHGEK